MLRLLDPVADRALYEEAYNWRPAPKKHVGTNKMSFETFADPHNIVVALFDPDFIAVFVFHELEPQVFQCHFTSRQDGPRGTLIHAARELVSIFLANGAKELIAWIMPRNTPLRRFVEELGFVNLGSERFACNDVSDCPTMPSREREFQKYGLKGDPSSG
jgi:hypothetical protein